MECTRLFSVWGQGLRANNKLPLVPKDRPTTTDCGGARFRALIARGRSGIWLGNGLDVSLGVGAQETLS